MTGMAFSNLSKRHVAWGACAAFLAACLTGSATAQTSSPPAASDTGKVVPAVADAPATGDSGVVQTGCSSCGAGGGALCGPGAPGSGGCGTCCYPGRNYCCSDCSECDSCIGKVLCGFYQCVCCPDPCYEPCWLAVADQGFFLDAARPVTQMRLRYTSGWNLMTPDRAEYFYARARTTPNQLEPAGPCARHGFGKGPGCIASTVDFQDLSLYTEAALGGFGFFTEIPYRHLDPDTGAASVRLQPIPMTVMTGGAVGLGANQAAVLPNDTRLTAAVALPATTTVLNTSIGLPTMTTLASGAILPNGQIIPPGTVFPNGVQLPAGTRLPANSTLPANTLLPAGFRFPPGTVLPAGSLPANIPLAVTTNVLNPVFCCPESGFGDLILGTKSMLLDCHLMQITFQFKTFLPTGNFTKGLGVGHVSLEPSLLCNLCVAPDTYLQSQFAYWIPIGGDALYQANIFHMHFSLNRVLCRPCPGVQVVGNIELNEWTICGGAYTDPNLLVVDPTTGNLSPVSVSATTTMVSAGPGIRLVVCDKLDFGVGSAFALTTDHWSQSEIRADFRWRY